MKMLKNNNQKFIRTLSGNCLKANKGRNGIAILAIALTAVLFMALTTVLQGAQMSMKEQFLRQAGTRLMVSVKNLTREEAEKLVENPEFTTAGMERYVANARNPELNNMNVAVGWADETVTENSFMKLEEGHYPEKDNEVACDSEVLKLLGLPYETGTTFTLAYSAGGPVMEKEMTVCGIWKGVKYERSASILTSESFVEETIKHLEGDLASLRENSYNVRGSFQDEKDIEEKLDQLVEWLGYDPEAERGEEGFLIHHVNPAYKVSTLSTANTLIPMAAGVLLILLAGYLIIYNIFKISVEKDIRLYGQLKTIGASPKQIRYMITRQGMVLSFAGIPAGLVLGWLLGNALLPFVMTNSTAGEAVFIVPSLWIWLLSAAFTLITVRISCARPGRIAGKISPVEALKYHSAPKSRRKYKKGMESSHRILSMAAANLGRSKGKTTLVVLSISLSAILLNSVLNFTSSMDEETYVKRQAGADFDVRNADFEKAASEDSEKTVAKETADALEGLEGVAAFSRIYCHMLPSEDLTEGYEDLGCITGMNGKPVADDGGAFEPERMLYGYDREAFSKAKLIEGDIDYDKLCTGDYVVAAGYLGDEGEYYYEDQELHAGDVIEMEIEGVRKEYTVMAVVGARSNQLSFYSKGGYESIVFAEPVFLELFPEETAPIHCLIDAKDGAFDQLNEQVARIAEANYLSVISRLTEEERFREMQSTYSAAGGIVALVLGVIGILNLINVILTGVIARQREFASMRSIGMTRRQLQRLVVYEGSFYAVLAGVIGILCSTALSLTLVRLAASGMWFMKYHFTILPAAVALGICILLAALIAAMTDRVWNKGSIMEQLRQIE